MARVSLVVHGRGRGHASRALACARALTDAGHALHVFGGGDSEAVLKNTEGLSQFTSIPLVLPGRGAPAAWWRRLASDRARFADPAPECIVSDGDQPSLAFARRRGIASVTVDHSLALTCSRLPIAPPLRMRVYARLNTAPLLLADRRIAVHFLPFASTVPQVAVARPDLRDDLRGPLTRDGFVLAYFRDDNGARPLELALAAGAEVVCFSAVSPGLPGLRWHRPDRAAFAEHLRRCDAVITSAGSNVLAECVMLGKPALALYRRDDGEQALNARLAEHAGVAVARSFDAVSASDVATFLARARAGDFAALDLAAALPPVSEVVTRAVAALLV